jgi:iron complex outermembrane receptor protein
LTCRGRGSILHGIEQAFKPDHGVAGSPRAGDQDHDNGDPERRRPMNGLRCAQILVITLVVTLSAPLGAQDAAEEPAAPPASAAEPAAAQESAEQPTATHEVSDEIIVTATKREQPLQEVPIPVAAVTGEELTEHRINSMEDLQFLVPNITFGNDFNFAKLYVRGLGFNSSFHGVDPSVALHVDGAVVARASAQFASLFDLERVEVLRGPQGTLYGRNNTGGTVNLVTRKPSAQRGGHVRFSVGGDDLNLVLEGAVDAPLSEKVLSRFALRAQNRDGYGVNETSGNDVDDAKQYSGRGQILFLPSEHFDFAFIAEYYEEDDHAFAVHFLEPSFAGNPPGFTALGLGGTASEPRNTRSRPGFEPMNFKNTWYLTGRANWTLSEDASVRSITNFRKLKTILGQDFTMSDTFFHNPLPLLPGQTSAIHDLEERQWQFSEELQVIYDKGRMHSIFGVYYLQEEVDGDNTIGHDPFNIDDRSNRVLLDGWLDVEAYAAFANFTFDLSDRFSLRVAGRFSHEERDLTNEFRVAPPFSPINLPNAAPPSPNSEAMPFDVIAESWDDFSPEVGFDWRAKDDVLVYFTYAQGFKSGNAEIGNNNPTFVEPEEIENFELGMKSNLSGNKVQLNLAGFFYTLKNGQFNKTFPIPAPPFFITTLENAAEQEGRGIEMDLRWRASDRFQVNLSATYLDAEYTEFFSLDPIDPAVPFTPDPTTLPEEDISGNVPRNSPKWQYNLGAAYDHPLASGATLTFAANVAYKDRQFYTEFNDPRLAADAYTIADATLRYTPVRGSWAVDAWIKNIGDELVVAGAFPISTSRTISGTYLPPRRYGVTLSYNF